jgi:APA family basic amino acid/polyamine antiporter
VLLLRGRRPDLPRPYRCPGYPLVPIVFILATGGLLLNSMYQRPGPALGSVAAIAAGIPVFYFWRRP